MPTLRPTRHTDTDVVFAFTVKYLTAFFGRELLGDTSVGAAFDGVGAQADITAKRVEISSK